MSRMLDGAVLAERVGDISARGATALDDMARDHPGASFTNSYACMPLQPGASGASPHLHAAPHMVVEAGSLVLNACTALRRHTAECERTISSATPPTRRATP